MAKRALDIIVALVALAVLAPVFVGIGLAIALSMGRPVLFRQTRPGLRGRPFQLIKFRTMSEAADEAQMPLPDAARLGRFGRFLRASSIDETTEFWNVLRGEMSLVGPRPLLTEYLPLYSPEQFRRHEVRPGITGWAQVHGRNSTSWDERFALDIWYVDNRSMRLDLKILWLTIRKVLQGEGITYPGEATMPKFRGTIR